MKEGERTRVQSLLRAGLVPDLPDEPRIETFEPLALAEILEQQATRAKLLYDVPKVDLKMDADDAIALAGFLRNGRRL